MSRAMDCDEGVAISALLLAGKGKVRALVEEGKSRKGVPLGVGRVELPNKSSDQPANQAGIGLRQICTGRCHRCRGCECDCQCCECSALMMAFNAITSSMASSRRVSPAQLSSTTTSHWRPPWRRVQLMRCSCGSRMHRDGRRVSNLQRLVTARARGCREWSSSWATADRLRGSSDCSHQYSPAT